MGIVQAQYIIHVGWHYSKVLKFDVKVRAVDHFTLPLKENYTDEKYIILEDICFPILYLGIIYPCLPYFSKKIPIKMGFW